ncbi:MAG: M48 family metalloprotease [Pseudomonadota bacterium]
MAASTDRAKRPVSRWRARSAAVALGGVMALSPTLAEAQGFRFIRDTEIEDLLNDYSRPILRAAGLGGSRVKMRVLNNPSFNAFVLDGRNIFMNTGTLTQAETPNAVIGVIAHEAGHIAGSHLAGLRAKIKRDSTRLLLAQILGVGALIAGGASGNNQTGEVVGGIGKGLLGGSSTVVQRSILSYRRVQEAAADQAAVNYLNDTKQSSRGMLETFEILGRSEIFTARVQDVYTRSHPVPQTRISQLRRRAQASPYFNKKDSAELQLRHDLMRAKLSGYLDNPKTVFNRYPKSDRSMPAVYARAIASSELGDLNSAIPRVRQLIKARPRNPYFHELEGEILFRAGRSAQAIAPLQRALRLRKDAPLIQIRLAQAMLGTNARKYVRPALRLLRQATVTEKRSLPFRLLARAYAAEGKRPEAQLASAKAYFYEGNRGDARRQAERAKQKFKRGSAQWVQADDIIRYTKRK